MDKDMSRVWNSGNAMKIANLISSLNATIVCTKDGFYVVQREDIVYARYMPHMGKRIKEYLMMDIKE